MNECPLGAAALAGSPFPIDRHATAQALGFDAPTANSLDSVSDRDFALEFLGLAAICATHLSRLAEEIVIWSTPQFGFVKLSDSFSSNAKQFPNLFKRFFAIVKTKATCDNFAFALFFNGVNDGVDGLFDVEGCCLLCHSLFLYTALSTSYL